MNDLLEIKKMLTALLKNQSQLHWIGGYVHGRTGNDDPFILLYPSDPRLKEKICRVYPHDFKKLPDFVSRDIPPGITQDGNPNKEKAAKHNLYHECPPFLITTYRIPNANMEYEVRFCDVLRISNRLTNPASPPAELPPPLSGVSRPPGDEGQKGEGSQTWCEWCHDRPSAPGLPCPSCQQLGATPANKPTPKPAPPPSTPPVLTERQKQLRELYDYAKSKKMSKGAVDLELQQHGDNILDTLHALQVEHGDRQTPPKREAIDATKYYAYCLKTLGWSRDGAKKLLDQYHGDFTAAHHHAQTHQKNGIPA